jgi:hypothetical protein
MIFENEEGIVYRVEDEEGIGPHQAEVLPRLWRPTKNRPLPEQEFDAETLALLRTEGYVFGFLKPSDALCWFGRRTLDTLGEFGFVVREVPAIEVYEARSGHQIIFRPHPDYVPGSGREVEPGRCRRRNA